MKHLKLVIVLALVFAAGFAGGVATTRAVFRHFVQRAVKDPDFMRATIEKRAAMKLRLDAQQRDKLDAILRHTQTELKDLRGEFQPRFLEIISHTEAQVEDILTPAQKERFEKLRAEHQHWWTGR